VTYHHGDLPAALLNAVEEIVRERGIGAVTLREAARRAGVSHAAPAHHFGDKAGLLTAFAAQGCALLRARLIEARDSPGDERSPLFAIGLAYVRFAIERPEHFAVMFRSEYVHGDDAEDRAAREAAFGVLLDSVRAIRPDLAPDDPSILHAATGAWATVHGIATLWLDGNLDPTIVSLPPQQAAAEIMTSWGETLLHGDPEGI
jgi:AcrR family transcriptional regulator